MLFVGNSLTYVSNLPAVLEALAQADGRAIHADMIVKGGATLTQWLGSDAMRRALKAHHYDYVVLQERGGDFTCNFGPRSCMDARRSLGALVRIAREAGAEPLLLGTYVPYRSSSAALVAAESKAARIETIPYLAASNRLIAGREQFPQADWFWADGMHPGHDLVLLETVLLYRQIFGLLPAVGPLPIQAPMFVPSTKFLPPDAISRAQPTGKERVGYMYPAASLRHAVELARGP